MVIADIIVELYSYKVFDLLVITPSDNPKYRYYYDRLSKKCHNSFFYKNKESIFDFLKFTKLFLKTRKIYTHYENIYLASLDSKYIQYIVSQNPEAKVFTFDDGTANILPNTIYSKEITPSFFKRKIWKILGIKYYMTDIKKLSLQHYTIYKELDNIITNTKFIELKDNSRVSNYYEITETKRFYLGQPLNEISTIYDLDYIKRVTDQLAVDFYYPHPREDVIPSGSFKVINNDLIFEDYLINYLKENPSTEVYVYSFTSSCILNITNIPRVKPVYILDDYLNLRFSELYKIANEKLSISLLRI